MSEFDPDRWEVEIETLIHELIESGLLSGEEREEVESLLERDHYEEAGRIAVNNSSCPNALAD